ncbi:MAG: BlaI/MecI/CopY family transcriptional regulator [Planctomycetales bacterium]|jgi:BlaI family penicillinase repressor
MRRRRVKLADLQLAIMQVLWDREEATVAVVREAIEPRHSVAHTTVATMLSRMEADGYVAHRSEARANIYRPLIGREDAGQSMVSDLADRLFRGDRAQMMTHLLAGADITPEELARLKKLVRDKESEMRNGQ